MVCATKMLATYVHKLQYQDIPRPDLEYMKLLLLDYFAASYAGRKVNTVFNRAMEQIFFDMGGKAEATVQFSDEKLPAQSAAILNATYAHGADMDDGHKRAMGHVGAHVFSAAFAFAETLNVTQQEVIEAIVAGYEVYIRVSAAAQPGLAKRGFHSTGTAGAVACAAACAKLLKLGEDGIYNAMAIAVTQASGLLIVAESGQTVKPINPAKAAQSGIISALLAKNGVIGATNPLESQKGWFHAMTDRVDETMITRGLGTANEISQCYFKPYPSCRHTHCGIEAAQRIFARNRGRQIERVRLYIYENAIRIAGQILHPANDDDAKFSIHYTLACALVKGSFGLEDLAVQQAALAVDELIDRIELVEDSSMEDREKGIRGARVEVFFTGGERDEETVPVPKGDPEVPFTLADMRQKLADCCRGLLSREGQERLVDNVMRFGTEERFVYQSLIG